MSEQELLQLKADKIARLREIEQLILNLKSMTPNSQIVERIRLLGIEQFSINSSLSALNKKLKAYEIPDADKILINAFYSVLKSELPIDEYNYIISLVNAKTVTTPT